jgi:hypothetical protein
MTPVPQPYGEPHMFNRRAFLTVVGATMAATCGAGLLAEEVRKGVLYPTRRTGQPEVFSWYESVVKTIPPLRHARGARWPLIAWEGFSFEPQPESWYKALLERGFAQHIRMQPGMVDAALAIQRAGSPVIAMEGGSGPFPATLAGEPAAWAHQLDPEYKPKGEVRPCPSMHSGWAVFADQLRGVLKLFRDRGVRLDAVWADWEGDPLYGDDRHEQARHCARCRRLIPAKALSSGDAFRDYTTRVFYDLFGVYYAAPVLEYFPKCSVTNWLAQPSTPEDPQPGWSGSKGHVQMPPVVTAWNPTAYGAASWVWKERSVGDRANQRRVDDVYTNVLLRQVSLAGRLTERWAPEKELVPWVCRWVSEGPETEFPVMSRERYREVLRQLWLRGIAAMQVFGPRIPGFEEMGLPELQDAALIYDEMLAYREILEGGTVLNWEVPPEREPGVLWSGMRLGDEAILRVFNGADSRRKIGVRIWPGRPSNLVVDSGATTLRLRRA